jgi:hypothetical protein
MRTAKHRNVKNRTIKGGLSIPNTKVHLIVRKSKLGIDKLIYDLVIARPAFPFITDYVWFNMNAVDEALALIRMKEVPVKDELGNVDKPEPDVLYKDTFEYGYNEIENEKDDDSDSDSDSDYTDNDDYDNSSTSERGDEFDTDDEDDYDHTNKKRRRVGVIPSPLQFKIKRVGGTKRSKVNPTKSNQTRSKRSKRLK